MDDDIPNYASERTSSFFAINKFITSVSAFWELPVLSELRRRVLIFKCQKAEIFDKISHEEIDFDGLAWEVDFFWREAHHRELFGFFSNKFNRHHLQDLLATYCAIFQDYNIDKAKNLGNLFLKFSTLEEVLNPLKDYLGEQLKIMPLVYTQHLKLLISEGREKGILDAVKRRDVEITMTDLG